MNDDEQKQWDIERLTIALDNLTRATSTTSQPHERARTSYSLGVIRGILFRRGLLYTLDEDDAHDA